jgi:hypothetical protein
MADPAKDYASISLLQLQDDAGTFVELEDARSCDYEVTKDRKVVQTMNKRRRAKGFQSANLMLTVTIEVPQRRGRPEYDWLDALLNDRLIQLYVERDDGGQRFILADLMVTSVAPTSNTDGEAMERISLAGCDIFKDATQAFDVAV